MHQRKGVTNEKIYVVTLPRSSTNDSKQNGKGEFTILSSSLQKQKKNKWKTVCFVFGILHLAWWMINDEIEICFLYFDRNILTQQKYE